MEDQDKEMLQMIHYPGVVRHQMPETAEKSSQIRLLWTQLAKVSNESLLNRADIAAAAPRAPLPPWAPAPPLHPPAPLPARSHQRSPPLIAASAPGWYLPTGGYPAVPVAIPLFFLRAVQLNWIGFDFHLLMLCIRRGSTDNRWRGSTHRPCAGTPSTACSPSRHEALPFFPPPPLFFLATPFSLASSPPFSSPPSYFQQPGRSQHQSSLSSASSHSKHTPLTARPLPLRGSLALIPPAIRSMLSDPFSIFPSSY